MITGVKPDESTNRRIKDELKEPMEVNSGISLQINNTIMKAMAIDRHMRFSTIEEFEKALSGAKPPLHPKKEKKRRKQRRFFGLIAAMLVVAVSAGLFYFSWERQRQEEILPYASISVAFMLTGDEHFDNARQNALEAVIEDFLRSPAAVNVNVELRSYPLDEYKAAINGNPPNLFYSTGLSETDLSNTVKLNSVINRLEPEEYNFLGTYTRYFPEQNQLPLSFAAPVLYINTVLSEFTGDSVSDLSELQSELTDNKQLFLDGEAAAFLSDSRDFFGIDLALPARYRVIRVETESPNAIFTDLWSVNQSSANERRAALRLLEFLLSDIAQDYLFIRNSGNTLPLNKTVLDVFSNVYHQFDGFFVNLNSYQFLGGD
jgi:ABC-type glycerol-3-phosphate transport system substrate-binding protein